MFASSKRWEKHSITMSFIVGVHSTYNTLTSQPGNTGSSSTYSCCMRRGLIFVSQAKSRKLDIHRSDTLKLVKTISLPGLNSDERLWSISCGDEDILHLVVAWRDTNDMWRYRFVVYQVNEWIFLLM